MVIALIYFAVGLVIASCLAYTDEWEWSFIDKTKSHRLLAFLSIVIGYPFLFAYCVFKKI